MNTDEVHLHSEDCSHAVDSPEFDEEKAIETLLYIEGRMKQPGWENEARDAISGFADVSAARALRLLIIDEIATIGGSTHSSDRCPICGNIVGLHNSTVRCKTGGWIGIPCWRRGEWDKYGLHVAPTKLRADEVILIP